MADSGGNFPPGDEGRKGGAEGNKEGQDGRKRRVEGCKEGAEGCTGGAAEDKLAINQTHTKETRFVITFPPKILTVSDDDRSTPDKESKNKNATGSPKQPSSVKKGIFVGGKMKKYEKTHTEEHSEKEVISKNSTRVSDARKREKPDQLNDDPKLAADKDNIEQENKEENSNIIANTSGEMVATQDEEQPAKADSQQAHGTCADSDLVNAGNSQQEVLLNIQHIKKDESFMIVEKSDCKQEDPSIEDVLGVTNNISGENQSRAKQRPDDEQEKFRKEKEEISKEQLNVLGSKSPTVAKKHRGLPDENASTNKQGGEPAENASTNKQGGETDQKIAANNQDTESEESPTAKVQNGEGNGKIYENDLFGTEDQSMDQTGVQQTDDDTIPESDAELSRSNSFVTVQDEPEEETSFDETLSSLDVLKSMTHISDDNRVALDNNKTKIKSVQGIDEPYKGQMKKEGPLPHYHKDKDLEQDLESSNEKRSTTNKQQSDTTQYTLEQVGDEYLLLVNDSHSLKVPELDGKSNVSLSKRYILINGKTEYFIHNKDGTITIKEIKLVKVQKVRSTCPDAEELLNSKDEISKADKSHSQVSQNKKELELEIEKIAEGIEGLDIEEKPETMQIIETKQLQSTAEQIPIDSRCTSTNPREISPPTEAKKEGQAKSESKPKVSPRKLLEQAPGIAIAAVTSTSTNPTGTPPIAVPRKSINKEEVVKFTQELVNSKIIKEGRDLKLECCVSHTNLTVRWFKDGQPLECSEKIRAVSSETTHSLEIQKVVPTDSGKYTVKVGKIQSNSTVTVEEKVKFTRELISSERMEEGLDLTLKCCVSHLGLTASWFKDGKPIEGSERCKPVSSGKTHSLEIKNVILTDSGKYTVEVDNIQSTSTVTIEEKAVTFTLPLGKSLETQTGNDLTLTCHVSKPDLEAKWTACGQPVNNSERFQVVQNGMVHTLVVTNVQAKDGGVYVVTVGGIQSKCTLKVHEKPSAPKNFRVGDITSESCKLCWEKPEGSFSSKIKNYVVQLCDADKTDWLDCGRCAHNYIKIGILKQNTPYLFRVAAETDFGTGEFAELDVPITTKDIESWTFSNESVLTLKCGESLTMELKFKGSVPDTWVTYNEKIVQDSRLQKEIEGHTVKCLLHNVRLSDEGKYTLYSKNDFGRGTITRRLKVIDKPSAPKNLTIHDVTSESVHLTWEKPDNENGSSITGYTALMCGSDENCWIDAGSSVLTNIPIRMRQSKPPYHFKVAAENEAGQGDFTEISYPIKTEVTSALEPLREDQCREVTFELQFDSPNHVQEKKVKMSQQKYMKWKYVTLNQRVFKEKTDNLRRKYGYDTYVDGEITKVALGRFETCPQLESITDDLIDIMLQNTDNLTEKAIPYSPGISGKEVQHALKELDVENVLYAEVDENASAINIVCNEDVEEKVSSEINGVLQTLELQLKTKLKTKSDSIDKPSVFGKKIELESFKNFWKKEFEFVEIKHKYNGNSNMVTVTLSGPEKDIIKAKKWIDECLCNEISYKDVKNCAGFTNIDQVLEEHFTSSVQNQEDVWHINEKLQRIGICATTPDATNQITQQVKKCIKKRSIKREDKHLNFNLELVELLREEIGEEHKPYIHIAFKDGDTIDVYGLVKHIDICVDDLQDRLRKHFQQQKTDVEKTVHRSKETKPQLGKEVKYFEKTLIFKDQLVFDVIYKSDSITSLKPNIQITAIDESGTKGFHLRGPEKDVNRIYDELKSMERNVAAWTVCSEIQHNQKTKFDEVRHELERSSPVVVMKEEAVDIDGVTSDAKKKVEWIFPNGHTVRIVQTCTSSDKKSCVNFVEDTKGCKDPFIENQDGSILMMVPVWKDGKSKEKDTIHDSFYLCLSRLFNRSVNHVDICIDHIITSWKVPMFVKQLLLPLKSFLKKMEEPITICFCCKNESITKDVYKSCKGAFTDGEHKGKNKSYGGVKVNVKKGNIVETKADIIVNTIGQDGQLIKGAISQTILKEAGHKIQEELNERLPIQKLKIYSTSAHNMKNYQLVFHVCLEDYENTDKCVKGLEDCVFSCLIKAEALKCGSIAFPALGTGALKYDLDKVICAMFGAVERFNKCGKTNPFLKEVNFVLYDENPAKMFRQEKTRRGMNHLEETNSLSFGNITLNAVNVPITDVDTDCILYVWDKQVIRTAAGKPDANSLLRELDTTSRSQWSKYFRMQSVPVFKVFYTFGDKNLNKVVIHVPYEDNKESKIKALVEGLKAAISMKKQSVAIYFDNAHPFLKDKDFMTKVSAAVSDTSPLAEQALDVTVVVIGNTFFENVKMFFRVYSQTSFAEQTEGVENVVMTVVGMEKDLSAAIEKLRNQKGVCLIEVHRPYPELNTKRKAPLPPKAMIMDRDATNDTPSPDDPTPKSNLTWKPEYLQRVPELELYVEMQNIPTTETTDSLKLKLFDLRLPIAIPELVYCDNSDVAIIICQTMEDAKKLSDHKSSFKFVRLVNKKTLHCFSSTLDARVWNMAKAKGLLAEIMIKLKEMHVVVINEETPEIKTFTLYQIKCARALLAKYDEQTKQKDKKSDSFVKYEHEVVVKNVDESVWDIVSEKCREDISLFENEFGYIKYENNTLRIPTYTGDKNEAIVKKIKSKLDETKKKEIVEIASTEIEKVTDMTKIPNCCKELETAFSSAWCVWNDKKKKIYVCDERYETAFQAKHQLSTKLGITKVTGRSRGNRKAAISKEDEKSTSDSLSDKLNVRQHPLTEDYSLDRIANHLEKFTVGNILVYVYQGDILKLPVDCIVNAANESLSHGGGVAAVIERAAGKDLTKEGNAIIAKNGKLNVGEACVTSAGNLHYKCVIHTVGPAWRDYSTRYRGEVRRCESDLYSAIYRCFEKAQERKMETIAIPAVSSAIFGVPADICVEQYAKATIDYCNKVNNAPDALSEIHFIDIKLDIVKKIQDSFRNMLREGRVSKGNRGHFGSQTTERKDGYENQKLDAPLEAGQLPKPLMYEDGWKKNTLIFAPNNTLTVCKSDIFALKASAIVVTVNKQCQGGRIGESLINKIPSIYMEPFNKELRKQIGNFSKIGDVSVIAGFSCGYASILFVVFPFEAQRGTNKNDLLRKAYSDVLYTAHRNIRILSVVTTLFGIDSSKDDELILAAEAFLDSYLSFCKQTIQYEQRDLDVTIACHTEHSYDVVLKVFNDYVKSKREMNESSGKEGESEQFQAASNTQAEAGEEEKCVICMDSIKEPKILKCGHAFCTECIEQYFTFKQQCPTCGKVCGKLTGDQPFGYFRMERNDRQHLAGYESYGTIVITYNFPSGVQGEEHPNPGTRYTSIYRRAYLPNNDEGNKIAAMLKVAFDRKLVFTIGSSRTTGQEGVITWNDIHHKTDQRPGTQFGYPDPTYFERVKDELAAKGVTEADIASQ